MKLKDEQKKQGEHVERVRFMLKDVADELFEAGSECESRAFGFQGLNKCSDFYSRALFREPASPNLMLSIVLNSSKHSIRKDLSTFKHSSSSIR